MKRIDERRTGIPGFLAVLPFVIALCLSNASAKDSKRGADLVIEKKGGQRLQGELLAVKGSRLLLLDSSSASGGELEISEIERIRIVKKPRIFSGLGIGSLLGGLAGLSIEGFSWDLGAFTLTGASLGGFIGAIQGIDETIEMRARPAEEMKLILKKLDGLSRQPEAMVAELSATRPDQSQVEDIRLREKFPRFHFSVEWGFFINSTSSGLMDAFQNWHFGDSRKFITCDYDRWGNPGEPYTSADQYPEGRGYSRSTIKNLNFDFSLTQKWAIGFIYSPLFKYKTHGYRCLHTIRDPYYNLEETQGLTLYSESSGNAYFLSASYMPIPDTELQKNSFKVGLGIGLSKIRTLIEVAQSSHQEVLSPGWMAFAEFHFWLWKYMSLGFSADYKDIPTKIKSIKTFGYWNGQNIPVELSEQRLNFGGIAIGLQLGFHI